MTTPAIGFDMHKNKKFIISSLALALFIVADIFVIFDYAPVDVSQGMVQKIFYWHVGSAFAMFLAFFFATIFSVIYLVKKKPVFDNWALSCVEIGFLFCTIVLFTGPIWAKPAWGVFWTWEPRLTSVLFLWLIFMSYFILRGSFSDPGKVRTYSAVLTIFGFLDVPIIAFAVKLWRGAHPIILGSGSNMPAEMWITFAFTMVTVFFLAVYLVVIRAGLAKTAGS